MTPTRDGSFRLFRLWGIDVYLHWSWLMVAAYSVSTRAPKYESPVWAVAEYLVLFLVVLMHEFGHSLATRQVGGKSDQIVLWPLGGVAYVKPPHRPGAELWSIAAGPLVNVVLVPVFFGLFAVGRETGAFDRNEDLFQFMRAIIYMNLGLLVFNLLPIYPLDGGQILRSLLWYPFGKARSLLIATVIGFGGAAWLLWRAFSGPQPQLWLAAVTAFLAFNCWRGFQLAKQLRKIEQLPRRPEFKCASCHSSPPRGNYWLCPACQQAFDPFATNAQCPHCSAVLGATTCPDCGEARDQRAWDASIRDA